MSLTIPNTFVGGAGHKAYASEVNANFLAVAAKFTEGPGGIIDEDISTSCDLNSATKLSSTPGKQITAAKIGDKQVTDAKLAFDAAIPGSDASRAVSGDHIKALTSAALARILPAAGIAGDKLNDTIVQAAFGPLTVTSSFAAGPVTGSVSGPAIESFAKADYDVVGFYILGDVASGGSWVAEPIIGTGGTNYNFAVRCYAPGSGSYSGTLVAVFRKKVTV